MPEELTPGQVAVLAYIKRQIALNGYSPTVAEIADHFGIYANGIQYHIKVLEKKGWITKTAGRARTIQVVACELANER